MLLVLGRSHQYSCPRGDFNTQTGEISSDRGFPPLDGTPPLADRGRTSSPSRVPDDCSPTGTLGRIATHRDSWPTHLLRDLRDLYQFEPGKQDWAEQMAGLLIEARDAGRTAHAKGEKALDPATVSSLTSRYRAIAGTGLAANVYRRTATAGDARRIARRFIRHENMILRFITRPDLDIFTIIMRLRGPSGRSRSSSTAQEAAGAPSTDSPTSPSSSPYLSTATKWGIAKLDALRGLFKRPPLDATRSRTRHRIKPASSTALQQAADAC